MRLESRVQGPESEGPRSEVRKGLKSKVQSPRFKAYGLYFTSSVPRFMSHVFRSSFIIPRSSFISTAYSLKPTACPGLTVLELIVAMGVAGLFYGVLYNFYVLHARALKVQEIKLDLQESSRLAIDFLIRELHFAGARPVQGGTCAGFERLTNAESQRITLQYDYRGNSIGSAPDGCPDDPNERVTYLYEPATQLLKRSSSSGAPQPFIGDVPSDGFLLQYLDRDGNDLGSSLNPDQRAAVHSIVVTVGTSKRHPDPQVTEPLTSEHTSTVFLPNPAR